MLEGLFCHLFWMEGDEGKTYVKKIYVDVYAET